MRFIDLDGRSATTYDGEDAQSAYWYFYFGGSVSGFDSYMSSVGNGSGSNSNGDVPKKVVYAFDTTGAVGGGGGGSSLSPWMQANMGIDPMRAGIYAHRAMANFFNSTPDLRTKWFSEKTQSIWKWDLKMRPDLHYMNNGINAVWELKPISHFMESSLSLKGQFHYKDK